MTARPYRDSTEQPRAARAPRKTALSVRAPALCLLVVAALALLRAARHGLDALGVIALVVMAGALHALVSPRRGGDRG